MPALSDNKNVLSKYVVNLKGKKYLQVSGRIYSAHNARQLISLTTELIDNEDYYVVLATAKVLNDHMRNFENLPLEAKIGTFTGLSRLPKRGGNMKAAEGTNPLETCETSAVGRALGFAGFGDLESIASAEEMEVAFARQAGADEEDEIDLPPVPMTPTDVLRRELGELLPAKGFDTKEKALAEAKRLYGENITSLKKLDDDQMKEWIDALQSPDPEVAAVPF